MSRLAVDLSRLGDMLLQAQISLSSTERLIMGSRIGRARRSLPSLNRCTTREKAIETEDGSVPLCDLELLDNLEPSTISDNDQVCHSLR
jgi:hypothetical protein